jgi:hypothetical protein
MNAEPMGVAMAFNERINAHDLAGLVALMTDDHAFFDTADETVRGKAACEMAWRAFFAAFPDYHNLFDRLKVIGGTVSIPGQSHCIDPRLHGPALWSAKVRGGQVAEWRVYGDTPANRKRLSL